MYGNPSTRLLNISGFSSFDPQRRGGEGYLDKTALCPEVVYVGISDCLFIHTSITPNNFPNFNQKFAYRVSIMAHQVPSSVGPPTFALTSHLRELHSQPGFNLLPVLHLCLLVSRPCPVGGRRFGVLPYVWSSHGDARRKRGNGNRIGRKGMRGEETGTLVDPQPGELTRRYMGLNTGL